MATRKITNFDINPLPLRPAVTPKGNYQVSVGPMPLTNQAYQLSESLKKLPALGKQFAQIQQGIGQERADLIQGQDAEEELNRLKKEEPETFFNFMRRKAYSDSLIEKHIRTEMVPKTLQGLKKSANARLYGSEKDFNANVDEQLKTSWQEFEQSVGEDVANSVAGRTVWNNLADQMRAESQADYFESQDAVALENDLESIEHRISSQLSPVDIEGNARDIDPNFISDFTKTTIPELMNKHGMSRGDASSYLRQIMATRLAKLQVEGKNLMVLDLADAMHRTVSKDGVRIYEGDSKTALSMARTLADARNEIEALEDEEDDIDQTTQKRFVGQSMSVYRHLKNGTRWEELTPTEQQMTLIPLQTLDPTFTMEKLVARMSPAQEGDVGGGLEVFSDILDELNVNGSDRARSLIEQTRTSLNHARVTASQLKSEPKVVLGSIERGTIEKAYLDAGLTDANLTLQKFVKRENILPWPELTKMETELKDVHTLMRSPAFEDVPSDTQLVIDAVYASLSKEDSQIELGLVTKEDVAVYAKSFSHQIQEIMKEEAKMGMIKSSVTPEEKEAGIKTYAERQKELVANTRASIQMVFKASEGSDIFLQEGRVFDDAVGQIPLEHATVSEDARLKEFRLVDTFIPLRQQLNNRVIKPNQPYDMEAPFKTNASPMKEVKVKREDTKALGFMPLYNTYRAEWTPEEIETDRAEMIRKMDTPNVDYAAYQEQLAYSLYAHGVDIMPKEDRAETIELLQKAGVEALDVGLFTDRAEIMMFGNEVFEVFNKVLAVEKLNTEEAQLLEDAKALGLIVSGRLDKEQFALRMNKFVNTQDKLSKRHVR